MASENKGDQPEGAPAPAYLTVEEFSKREKAITAALAARIDKAHGDLLAKLADFQKVIEKPEPAQSDKPQPVEETPAYRGVLKRVTDLEAQLKAEKERTAEERAKATDTRLRTELGEALVGVGVDAKHVKHAVGYLVDATKRVRVTPEDEIVFHDGPGNDAVDLSTGLKAWIASEDARLYLAPRGIVGSGDKPSGASPPRNRPGEHTREALAVALQQALKGEAVHIG